ncbi:MAG: inositol monophosphatase family protein, partial [Bifidobacteriaceae bacterium]|nr:inositol monophosphatase family protein [Bifidobacteriaceae bacterium]
MNLQELALEVARVVCEAGEQAFRDQLTPTHMEVTDIPVDSDDYSTNIDSRLVAFIENRLNYIEPFNGSWRNRPENLQIGERYWCVGNVDGIINFKRNLAEWALTVSLFEVNNEGSARPMIGVVHAPALGITYLAVRDGGAIRIRSTEAGERREKIIPSTTNSLHGSVISYGMSFIPEESLRALNVVSQLAGKPADIKRIGPASLDLCRVADGTYDAYFEPHLHEWDISAVSAGALVVREAQGHILQWDGSHVH